MKRRFFYRLMVLGLCLIMMACSEKKREYIIGVSQCSEDIWRSWQNSEMQMEANFHEGVELRFTAANDDSQRQIQQIDSLVDSGIDLLIVAPNQRASVTPAIDRAFDKGIPVIVFERKTDSQKYTAFVSADNYEMGHQMGGYIVIRLSGKGQVLELLGLKGSSPADDRHRGFRDAINTSFIEVPITLQGDWTEEKAYKEVKNYKGSLDDIDLVFAHNDRSAIGARRAFIERGVNPLPMFCGIDGLPGENGGIQQVRDSLLEASYIYPTRGDHLLKLALDILDGKEYQRETVLTSAIVTHDNANVLLLESDEVLRQAQNLDKLQAKAKGYLEQLAAQRTITLMALILLALVILVLVLFYLYHRGKVSAQRERMVSNLWNIDASEVVEHYNDEETPQESSDEKQTENTSEKEETDDNTEIKKEPLFIVRFKDVVEARLSNSDITVDDLAEAMNLSRVQLYRKVKAISGSSPNELLRTARLNRAYQLLLTTDKNISEVAYDVGFTAPSYFTKCFKDEFGVSPSDLNQG